MIIVDAHQDLAWNILTFGRDYTLSAAETRQREQGTEIPNYSDDTLLGWPDYQRGSVALIFSTLFVAPIRKKLGDWDTQSYADTNQAHAFYNAQLDAYYRLVETQPDKFRLVTNKADLNDVLSHWNGQNSEAGHPVGLVSLMEGAEGVRAPAELEEWWERGVRIIGPAWLGTRFCGGTHEPGPLTKQGYALLEAMADLGFTLDISHMDEKAVLQSLDFYEGKVIATHANAAALLKGTESNRFLSDRVIAGLIERGGIIGVVPYNRFLVNGWLPGDGRLGLNHVISQIDHLCQIAGDANHVGIGSDFDGGFGLQQVPAEIDTIADLQKLVPFLGEKGYTDEDIAAVLGGNWLRFLEESLPDG